MAESRQDIELSIVELEKRKADVENFMDGSLPEVIQEILTEEVETIVTAIKQLNFALDTYYKGDCMVCGKRYLLDQPALGSVCSSCFGNPQSIGSGSGATVQ